MIATDSRILAVKLPDDAHDIDYRNGVNLLSWQTSHSKSHNGIDFYETDGSYTFIGIHSAVKTISDDAIMKLFPGFMKVNGEIPNELIATFSEWCHIHKVYSVNPWHDYMPIIDDYVYDNGHFDEELFNTATANYMKTQPRVGTWAFLLKLI